MPEIPEFLLNIAWQGGVRGELLGDQSQTVDFDTGAPGFAQDFRGKRCATRAMDSSGCRMEVARGNESIKG